MFLIDLHTHTNYSPHAYSSLMENVQVAKVKGMLAIASTNHGPKLPDSPHPWALLNQKAIPEIIDGIRVYKGAEANIVDDQGNIDLTKRMIDSFEIIIGGFHQVEGYGNINDIEKNTRAAINVIKSGNIDIFVHLGNPAFPIDYEKVIKEAKKYGVAIELNNSSYEGSRSGSPVNCKKIVDLCKENGNIISLGSDSHFCTSIGGFDNVIKELERVDYDKTLVLNHSIEFLEKFLTDRGRKFYPRG